MTRKLIATGIAVIVSIPLIPVLKTGIGHLTGTDAPIVAPTQGWTLLDHDRVYEGTSLSAPTGHYRLMLDRTGSSASMADEIAAVALALGSRVSADPWRLGEPRVWMNSWLNPPLFVPYPRDFRRRTNMLLLSDGRVDVEGGTLQTNRDILGDFKIIALATHAIWADESANANTQAASILVKGMSRAPLGKYNPVPTIDAISPASATAGGTSLTATVTGTGFASGATVIWNASPGATTYSLVASATSAIAKFPLVTVTSVSPSSAITAGQTITFSISGSGFASDANVVLTSSDGIASASLTLGGAPLTHAVTNAARQHRVEKTGWYALEAAHHESGQGLIDVEFVSDSTSERKRFTLKNSGSGGEQAAWVHFSEPGSLVVRASGAEPALRGMDYAEFISRWRDNALQRGVLTVTLFDDVPFLIAYILLVCMIRVVAYRLIGKLPRVVRKRATEEVDLMLAFAKWAGVACYTIWTAKDILAGVGVVFAGG